MPLIAKKVYELRKKLSNDIEENFRLSNYLNIKEVKVLHNKEYKEEFIAIDQITKTMKDQTISQIEITRIIIILLIKNKRDEVKHTKEKEVVRGKLIMYQ